MTSTTSPHLPTRYDLEVPEGWTGIEHPRVGGVFELVLDEPVGYASRLSFERYLELEPSPDPESGPMDHLIGERVSSLAESMTDGRFLDLALYGPPLEDDALPAFRATVAYRHGPHLVTAFLWALPLADGGALVATGLTDADMVTIDADVFDTVMASLRFGDDAEPIPLADQPPAQPEPAPRVRAELPAPPPGWVDGPIDDDRVLRQLVADDAVSMPAVISVMAAPAGLVGDALDRHAAILDDLASTMTDAELTNIAPDPLAIGAAQRSLMVFRQGERVFTADVWTGDEDANLPVVWAICDFDDDAGRDRAVAWIRGASREELGAA